MSESYAFKDEDGDWWTSEDGEAFTFIHWDGAPSDNPDLRDQPLDKVTDVYGIIDDGATSDGHWLNTHAEPLRTLDGGYITKDSGERAVFESGMQRDTEAGKPRFDLLIPDDVAYEDQFLTRVAMLMGRGAEKYDDRNWEKADSEKELRRMKSSAFRHFMQWLCGEQDEDHAAAVVFNLLAHTTIKHKIDNADAA